MYRPVYITDYLRFALSRHNGKPIVEERNEVYGYWATSRDMTDEEITTHFGSTYLANK